MKSLPVLNMENAVHNLSKNEIKKRFNQFFRSKSGRADAYAARIFSWVSSADHGRDDASWRIFAVVLFALVVTLNFDGDLLQHRRLGSTLKMEVKQVTSSVFLA